MLQKHLDGSQWHARHHKTTCERMAEIVPAKILNLGLVQNLIEPFPDIAGLWSFESRAYIAESIAQLPERL
jgi:hypothetical protein